MHSPLMSFAAAKQNKRFSTDAAIVTLYSHVNPSVLLHVGLHGEGPATEVTLEGPLSRVNASVLHHTALADKSFPTNVTLMWLLA